MPNWVKDKYGDKAMRQWEHVYNSCQKGGGSKESCAKQATSVVEKQYGSKSTTLDIDIPQDIQGEKARRSYINGYRAAIATLRRTLFRS